MPSSIINSDDGVISGTSGLKSSGGDDGVLNIQSNGTTVAAVNGSGVTVTGTLSASGATTLSGAVSASSLTVNSNNISADNSLGFRNRIINGDMRIDQRNAGASVTANASTAGYSLDRFGWNNQSGANFTIQRSPSAPAGFTNSMLYTVTSANSPSASQFFRCFHGIEGINFADLGFGTASAKPITISFWAFSNTAGTYGFALNNGAGNRAYAVSYTLAANTWTYVTASIPGDTSGTWPTDNTAAAYLVIGLGSGSNGEISANSWQSVGTYMNQPTGTNDLCATNGATFYITGVQLEVGSVATPFERRPYGMELSLCQRYYCKSYAQGTVPGTATGVGCVSIASSGTTHALSVRFPATMRATPTLTTYSLSGNSGQVSIMSNPDTHSSGTAASTQYGLSDAGFSGFTSGSSASPFVGCQFIASAEL